MKIIGTFYYDESNHNKGGFIITDCDGEFHTIETDINTGGDIKNWRSIPKSERFTRTWAKRSYNVQMVIDKMFYRYTENMLHRANRHVELQKLNQEYRRMFYTSESRINYIKLGTYTISCAVNRLGKEFNV